MSTIYKTGAHHFLRRHARYLRLTLSFCLPLLSAVPLFGQPYFGTWERGNGSLEIQALLAAYPNRIDEVGIIEGEWSVRIGTQWFRWAQGRLLPANEALNAADYSSIRFYNYSPGPPEFPEISLELEARLRARYSTTAPQSNPPRHNLFLDTLYGIDTKAAADTLMVRISFWGQTIRIHPMIAEPLRKVEAELERRRADDPAVAMFFEQIDTTHTYNWRNIAGTSSRSYHSYGIALDIVPQNYYGRFPYWRWAIAAGIRDWWQIEPERRWMVPVAVIEAFERQGFVWGGKWLFFDGIHFEYRPEILILGQWRANTQRL